MDDLAMVKACAEAMGLEISTLPDGEPARAFCGKTPTGYIMLKNGKGAYNPLEDDAQCFALVKRFRIYLDPDFNDQWQAVSEDTEALNANLNRAVVESVARMTLTPSSRPPDARRR